MKGHSSKIIKRTIRHLTVLLALCSMAVCLFGGLTACDTSSQKEVVIYTSVDQVFSEPILKEFEQQYGIKVLALYDTEANKTTGVVTKLQAEKSNPQADVYWSSEFVQTILLKEEGILTAYASPEAAGLPANFVDADNQWTAFGGRARVLIVNTNLLKPEQYPDSIFDLLNENCPADQIGLANPLFGTTATQVAALYSIWGSESARNFFLDVQSRGIQIVESNSAARDMVADGKLAFACVDTDDALTAIQDGKPVTVIFPDQDEGGIGTLISPNSVAMINGGPNPDEAKMLIDFLLSAATEQKLVDVGWIDIPSHSTVTGGYYTENYPAVKSMDIDFFEVYRSLAVSKTDMQELFIQ